MCNTYGVTFSLRHLSKARLYRIIVARDTRYDGLFFTAVTTTGIYCLPSCCGRKPKIENVIFYEIESEAVAAGFRPCYRCRPELFLLGQDEDRETYFRVIRDLQQMPERYTSTMDISTKMHYGKTKMQLLFRRYGGTTPAKALAAARVHKAAILLETSTMAITRISFDVGFQSEATFRRQFSIVFGLSPAQFRRDCRRCARG